MPPCRRAVREVVAKLRAAGHEVVEFKVPDMFNVIRDFYQVAGADGLDTYKASLGKDPMDSSIAHTVL
jgi:hypothetical protein